MDKKNVALIVMAAIILTIAILYGSNYLSEKEGQKTVDTFNEGVAQCVRGIAQRIINDGEVEITVPTINELNQSQMTTMILIVKPR